MMLCFRKEFHAAGLIQLFKAFNHFGRKFLSLVEPHPCKAVAYLEFSAVLANKLKHKPVCRQIAFLAGPLNDGPVFMVVKIITAMSYVKHLVIPNPFRLVNLEVKADIYHLAIHLVQASPRHSCFILPSVWRL